MKYEEEINKAFEYGCSVNRNVAKDLLRDYKKLKKTMDLNSGKICSLNNEVERFHGLLNEAEAENDRLKTIISYGYVLHKEDLINKENLKPNYVEWLETCKKIAEQSLKGGEK